MTILVVDGNADAREIALMSLELIGGFQVAGAKDGNEGLERAGDEAFGVVLIDPRIANLEELMVPLHDEEIPIILFNPDNRPRSEIDSRAIGTIAKPFAPDLLPRQVMEILKAHFDKHGV